MSRKSKHAPDLEVRFLVWLRMPGRGVEGWEVSEINRYIDEWNSPQMSFIRNEGVTFWEWFSWEVGEEYDGFSCLWSNHYTMRMVHTIKMGGISV